MDPQTLPVIPLRNSVLFPGVTLPIVAGRSETLKALETAQAAGEPLVLVVTQRSNEEDVSPDKLHTLGTIARIEQVQPGRDGLHVLLRGIQRGIAVRFQERGNFLEAIVRETEQMHPIDPNDPAFEALYSEVRLRADELARKVGNAGELIRKVLGSVESPAALADLVAGSLEAPVAERQSLLETLPVEERLRRVLLQVQRQLSVVDARQDIRSKVQEELGGRQREIFLREQLRAIQEELGEKDEQIDELRDKLDALELTEEVRKEVDRELKRLSRTNPEGMEAQVIRTYLETIAELPWTERSEEELDLPKAAKFLDEDHYGLEDVKDRILETLAVRQLLLEKEKAAAERAEALGDDTAEAEEVEAQEVEAQEVEAQEADDTKKAPILLFVGPPGVGKTSLARSIARSMGREYVRVSLGGARDEADIRGHRRTYVGAMPGRILQGMKQAGTRNPVFLLDEIDKLGNSFHGDPASALLEVLDPAQNDSFTDHYLGVPFDLSEVLFICTANFLQNIPGPLLDRMEMVEFSGYTEGEKLSIARQYLVPRQLRRNGLDAEQLDIKDEALARVISGYTREAGVRRLEREIGRLGRKVARKIAVREIEAAVVDAPAVDDLLGRPKVHPEKKAEHDQIGVATGMFYTPVGGDIMFVESSTMPGKGELVLTGQLGDVMKESARAAWSYARSHAEALHILDLGKDQDIHIHCPAGAIPKDGPSAGVTMATSLISSLSRRPVRNDLAMTGEITLNGRVLPIGGVKEKILGGVRAGIRTFVLPEANKADLEDLPAEILEQIEVIPVKELGEVLALALRDAEYREGRLLFAGQRPEDVVPLSNAFEN